MSDDGQETETCTHVTMRAEHEIRIRGFAHVQQTLGEVDEVLPRTFPELGGRTTHEYFAEGLGGPCKM